MIVCQYLADGRCQLAEQVAMQELSLRVVCSPSESACQRCLASGDTKRPSIACLQLVAPQVPDDRQPEWQRAFAKVRSRRNRRPRPEATCRHRGNVIENFPCQCRNGGKRPLYRCEIFGQCVTKKDLSERAAEHLRKKHPTDRQARKFAVCQGCDKFTSFDS